MPGFHASRIKVPISSIPTVLAKAQVFTFR